MTNPTHEEIITAPDYKKYIPYVTIVCCIVSLALFIGINTETTINSWAAYRRWGAPSAYDIWNGAYWGLITSNFLHTATWHIAFNLYWIWIFGKKIEFQSSKPFFIAFILSAALISSLAELVFSSSTGIGLSGVGYGMFGYILIKGKKTPEYAKFIDRKTVSLFVAWLVLCIVFTYSKVWAVGNAAHVCGMLWGILLAKLAKYNKLSQVLAGVFTSAFMCIAAFWQPWSIEWLSNKAENLSKAQQLDEAKIVYNKILAIDMHDTFAISNLRVLKIDSLSKVAFAAHQQGNYEEARRIYNQILAIDSANNWVKENMSILPAK